METTYKNSRQEEFAALMQTVENAGFKPADVARWLGVTPGAVSQYISGRTTPKESVIQFFRHHVDEKITSKKPSESTPSELQQKLEDLSRFDPAAYAAARATIETLHGRLDKHLIHSKPEASSGSESGAARLLKKASASHNKRGENQSP
jgi:hypothetical protein